MEMCNAVNEDLLLSLFNCKTIDEVESFFSTNVVKEYENKIFYFKSCTKEIATYYANNENDINIEDKYIDERAMFIDGTWRLFHNGKFKKSN